MSKKNEAYPVVLITGAAKRIGAELARLFSTNGFTCIIHYNTSKHEADELAKSLNEKRSDSCFTIQGDLNTESTVTKIFEFCTQLGRLDVLVNNASSFYPTPLDDCNQAQWDDLINSNLKSPFFIAKALAPLLRKNNGSIVNISDMHARQALANHPIYSIAKAGNIAMTKTLAKELAPNVRINSVAPGAILWPEHETDDLEKQQSILSKVPMGKLGSEKDITETTYFLAVEATYMTGQTIAVDGGSSNSL